MPSTILVIVGADGTVYGFAFNGGLLATDSPAALTALIDTGYVCPFDKSGTVYGEVVCPIEIYCILSVEYW